MTGEELALEVLQDILGDDPDILMTCYRQRKRQTVDEAMDRLGSLLRHDRVTSLVRLWAVWGISVTRPDGALEEAVAQWWREVNP